MPNAAINALKHAAKGLLYQSETDAPFEFFEWECSDANLTPATVRRLGKHKPSDPVQELALTDFFADLTEDQDWHGRKEKADVKKYRELEKTVRKNLADATVFRVGETEIDIYIAGKTSEGHWAGLKTRAVET